MQHNHKSGQTKSTYLFGQPRSPDASQLVLSATLLQAHLAKKLYFGQNVFLFGMKMLGNSLVFGLV